MKEIREECGVAALVLEKEENIGYLLYNALLSIQHRGQDAAGFAIKDGAKIKRKVGLGLVDELFEKKDMEYMGKVAIGHTRYPTTGRCKIEDVQPVYFENIALAHNGHISNYSVIKKECEKRGYKFKGTVDSEPLIYLIHYELKNGKTIEEAVRILMEKVIGSYSVVVIVNGQLIVFRDPHGIRPLVYGKRGKDYCFCSESIGLDVTGFEYVGKVEGGELIIIEKGELKKKSIMKKETRNCMFEYVYFSRPDSIINDFLVYDVRKKLGEVLAEIGPVDADVVIPVPDTSRTAAYSFAKKLGIEFDEGLIKNRYIGRTFIMMTQEKRKQAVRRKLHPIRKIIEGKRVVLVDDSIVRGTTMKEIVKLVRIMGATEVHLRITCPPIKAPCFYGIDMPTYKELIAHEKSIDEIGKFLGVDSLGYNTLDGLKKALGNDICTGCLNEDYFSEYVKKLSEKEKTGEGACRGCG